MGPFVRIILRYGVGAIVGYEVASQLATDPDVVSVVTVAVTTLAGIITEGFYYLARKWGWRT